MPEISFLVDANMPRSSVEVLENEGFDAVDVRDIGMGRATDDEIIAFAQREGRIVLTRDTDFGSVLRHPDHPGAVILRLPHTFTAPRIDEQLAAFLDQVSVEDLANAIIVVELGRSRRRPIDPGGAGQ